MGMEICSGSSADVLGLTDTVGAKGTGGTNDVGDVGNGAMTVEEADGAIRGSSVFSVGWSTTMSSTMSCGGRCWARSRSCHLSIVRMASQSQ